VSETNEAIACLRHDSMSTPPVSVNLWRLPTRLNQHAATADVRGTPSTALGRRVDRISIYFFVVRAGHFQLGDCRDQVSRFTSSDADAAAPLQSMYISEIRRSAQRAIGRIHQRFLGTCAFLEVVWVCSSRWSFRDAVSGVADFMGDGRQNRGLAMVGGLRLFRRINQFRFVRALR